MFRILPAVFYPAQRLCLESRLLNLSQSEETLLKSLFLSLTSRSLSLSLSLPPCQRCDCRRRRRQPLWRQRSPVRADLCWAARRAPTPRPRLPPRRRPRSRDRRPASVCWLPKRPPPFGRTRPRRARTASKSTSPRPRLACEGDRRADRQADGRTDGQTGGLADGRTEGKGGRVRERRLRRVAGLAERQKAKSAVCNANEPLRSQHVGGSGGRGGWLDGFWAFLTLFQLKAGPDFIKNTNLITKRVKNDL